MGEERLSRLKDTAFSILKKKYVVNYDDFAKEISKTYRKASYTKTKSVFPSSIKRSIINLYMEGRIRILWSGYKDFKSWDGDKSDLQFKIDGVMLRRR